MSNKNKLRISRWWHKTKRENYGTPSGSHTWPLLNSSITDDLQWPCPWRIFTYWKLL